VRVETILLSGSKKDSSFQLSLQRLREWTSKEMTLKALIVSRRERLQPVVLRERKLAESSLLYRAVGQR